MSHFNSRNLILLALAQLGVIVAAVLGASVVHKWYSTLSTVLVQPWSSHALMAYGWLGLLLPVVWLALTLHVFKSDRATERDRICAVLAGLLLLALCLGAAWHGAVSPMMQMMGGSSLTD